jgi:hypothetical protein
LKTNLIPLLTRGLGVTRTAMGLVGLARPQLVARGLGGTSPSSPDSEVLARMFAIRDIALATLALGDEAQTRRVGLRLGVLADSADAIVIVLAARKSLPLRAACLAAGFATLCAGAGLVAQYLDPESRSRRRYRHPHHVG